MVDQLMVGDRVMIPLCVGDKEIFLRFHMHSDDQVKDYAETAKLCCKMEELAPIEENNSKFNKIKDESEEGFGKRSAKLRKEIGRASCRERVSSPV